MGQPVSVRDLSTTSDRKSTLTGFTSKGKTWLMKVQSWGVGFGIRSSWIKVHRMSAGSVLQLGSCSVLFSFSARLPQEWQDGHGTSWGCLPLQREIQLIFILTFPAEVLRFAVIGLSRVSCWRVVMGLGLHQACAAINGYSKSSVSTTGDQALELNCLTSYLDFPAVWPGTGSIISGCFISFICKIEIITRIGFLERLYKLFFKKKKIYLFGYIKC